jgi:hypothetical protein
MKDNALRTSHCGLLGAHFPLHLVENSATLRRLDRTQALNMLRPTFLPRLLNWGGPAIQPLLVNLGHHRPGHYSPAKQVRHGQLRHHEVAVCTGADRLLGRGLLLAA